MVKRGVISSNFDKIHDFVKGKLENELKESAKGVKYCIICL